jgi:glucose-1-phosphate thymidylyltransferase
VDTLLDTNRHLLETGHERMPVGPYPRCTIHPPVYIEDGVTMHDCVIGPNVSLETGSFITNSTVANSIVGRGVKIVQATVVDSLVGDDQVIENGSLKKSVADGGEVAAAK